MSDSGRASWPKTAGAACLVLAALGSLGLLLTILDLGQDHSPRDIGTGLLDTSIVGHGIRVAISVASLVLLWAFGIGLVKRRRWSIPVGRSLGVLMLVKVVVYAVFFYLMFSGAGSDSSTDAEFREVVVFVASLFIGIGLLEPVAVGVAVIVLLSSTGARREWETWT